MKMNRRQALIGIGSLAVGSGAALGSGAFTQVEATRTVDASVVGDSTALLGLIAGSSSAVTNEGNNGQLRIDLSGNGGSSGVNDEAVTTIGEVSGTTSSADGVTSEAFTIENNSQGAIDVNASIGSGSSLITFWAEDGAGSAVKLVDTGLTGISSGNSRKVAIVVDTTGGSDDTGTSIGDLTFTATQN
jgi:hypothetical protein